MLKGTSSKEHMGKGLNSTARLLVVSLLFTFLVSCDSGDTPPENLLDRETFTDVMVDVQLLEAAFKQRIVQEKGAEEIMVENYAIIFDKHNITRQQFDSTYTWWAAHGEEMEEILNVVVERMNQMETDLRAQNAKK